MSGKKWHLIPSIFVVLSMVCVTVLQADIVSIPISSVTGSNGGNYAGTLDKMIDGSGMTQPDILTPSTWTATSNSYPDEWQASSLLSGATNSKIGWAAFNLGSSISNIQDLYLWNVREDAARGTNTYNIYYGDSPTVALPAAPPTNTLGSDYDFSSGGWTLFNTSGALSVPQSGSTPDSANAVVDLGGISAQYIGLEMLTNHGTSRPNVGLAEVAITYDNSPPPSGGGGSTPIAIAGVDFENAGNTAYDNSPDDLNTADGITVSSGWTVGGSASGVINDNNANNAGTTSGSYASKINGGTSGGMPSTTPDDFYSWSITIPEDEILDMDKIEFDIRAGTGSTSRWGMFNTSLDGGEDGGTPLWSLAPLPGRNATPNWEHVSVDLSGPLYQGLTDETVTFYWYAGNTGDDIDSIVLTGLVSAAAVPEPSTFALASLGLLGLGWFVQRRKR